MTPYAPSGELPPANLFAERESGVTAPFIIRAHHTLNLRWLLDGHTVEERMAGNYEAYGNYERFYSLHSEVHKSYQIDVFGETPESRQATEAGQKDYYETFLSLDAAAPVRIVAGQKDGMCNACAFGLHCAPQSADMIHRGDASILQGFRRTAYKIGLQDRLVEYEEEIVCRDGAEIKAPVIETDAQCTKEVIRDKYFPVRGGGPIRSFINVTLTHMNDFEPFGGRFSSSK